MNRYLEKIAQTESKKKSTVKDAASVGAGAYLLNKAPQRLLGYHTVYHGTTNENAAAIRKKGFDPSKGGSGASTLNSRYTAESRGKIHVTKTKLSARMYAGDLGGKIRAEKTKNPTNPRILRTTGSAIKDSFMGKGSVVKARLTHNQWEKMNIDRDSSGNAPNNPFMNERMKERAATSNNRIHKRFVTGAGNGGAAQFATRNNLRKYLGHRAGRIRALGGLGQLAAGSALIGNAVHNKLKNGGDK